MILNTVTKFHRSKVLDSESRHQKQCVFFTNDRQSLQKAYGIWTIIEISEDSIVLKKL